MPPVLTPQSVHVDAYLSAFSLKLTNDDYVGNALLPVLTVKKQSDLIAEYGREHLHAYDDTRSPGTPAMEIGHTVKSQSYFCMPHALKEKIPDEVRDNSDDVFKPYEDAVANVTDALLLNRELRIKQAVIDNGGLSSTDVSQGVQWDSANSRPDKDILTAIRTIHSKVFKRPNVIVIPFEVAVVLTQNDHIQELVKHTYNILRLEDVIILPKVLWGLTVYIAGAGRNTANLGQAESLGYIWGKDVVVAYVAPRIGPKVMTLGLCLVWKERTVKRWRDETISSDWVQVEEHTDEKILSKDCGHILKNVIS